MPPASRTPASLDAVRSPKDIDLITLGGPATFGASRDRLVTGYQRAIGNARVARLLRADRDEGAASNANLHIARKWTESLDGWGSNLAGDDDSKVTFTPAGKFETHGFTAEMQALMARGDAIAVGRRMGQAAVAGEAAYSSMDEPSSGNWATGTLPIKAGSKGTVEIAIAALFDMDEKWNDSYATKLKGVWEVDVDLEGNVRFIGGGMPSGGRVADRQPPFQLASFQLDTTEGAPGKIPATVTLQAVFVSSATTDIPNFTISGEIAGKVLGGGGSITLGNEETFAPGQVYALARLRLPVTDIPAPKEPEIRIESISTLREFDIFFPKPRHGKGQSDIDPAQERALIAWFRSLNGPTQDKIIAGSLPISLAGFASTTGKSNLLLSEKRMENVKKIFALYAGNHAQFDTRAAGENDARTDDEVESDRERRVHVSVWEELPRAASTPGSGTP